MERLTFDELIVAEAWLTDKSGDEDRAMEIINKAISHLRHLMKQDLSKAELVRYLRQQMGIEPKSEKLKDPLLRLDPNDLNSRFLFHSQCQNSANFF